MIKYPDKDKVIEEFKEKYIGNTWFENFIKNDEFYRSNKEGIDTELINTFDRLCKKCIKMQENDEKGEICYIYFSLLRTSILQGKGEFRIDFYDKRWFLDKEECSININLDFLYVTLFELKDLLKDKKNIYGRTISDIDIDGIILEEGDKYHLLACEFLKDIILNKFISLNSFIEMKKSSSIKILIGEFMDSSEVIYDGLKDKKEE